MFKLHRHRSSDRVGERFDFRFSNFRAVQVALSLPPALPPSPSLPRGLSYSSPSVPKSFLFPTSFFQGQPARGGQTVPKLRLAHYENFD